MQDLKPSAKLKRPFPTSFLIVAGGGLVVGIAVGAFFLLRSARSGAVGNFVSGYVQSAKPKVTVDETSTELDKGEKKVPSPINGVLKTEARSGLWLNRRPLAVMLNNHSDALAVQTGVMMADLVYEAVAEGGISRLMAIYHSQFPNALGSVRSARVPFVEWAKEYDAWYAHWGGASIDPNVPSVCAPEADAFQRMRTIYVSSLDAMGGSGSAFYREEGTGLATEHTGFVVPEKLLEVAYQMYPDQAKSFRAIPSWKFKEDAVSSARPASARLKFNFWDTAGYEVQWDFDSATNTYLRSQGGAPMKDAKTGERYAAKVVIVQWEREMEVKDDKHHILYETVGSGPAEIYQDGQVIKATWSRQSLDNRTKYLDAKTKKEIEFNRGLFWIEVLPTGDKVEYSHA
ncbi:MAG: DUF3048 domain-containing protein [bacterium]|nr:DUF3048 domain-containing protein [bacterium]